MFFSKNENKLQNSISNNKLEIVNTIANNSFNISDDILRLLWFGDGPLKNYNLKDAILRNNNIIITNSNRIEPSCIFTKLEIELVEYFNLSNIENLGYYPAYHSLTPKQRFYYLKWLEDTSQSIPVGYVFIFYYGLERHLMKGNFNLAFNEILKLRKTFNNGSFLAYSSDALLLSCLKRNKSEHLELLLDYLTDYKTICIIKILLNLPLSADDLINIRKVVGFTNDHYIKNKHGQFVQILEDNIFKHYNKTTILIDKNRFTKISSHITLALANVSLNKRENYIPDFFENADLCNELKSLLIETHDTIKITNKKRIMCIVFADTTHYPKA